jgi:hypothetical protein
MGVNASSDWPRNRLLLALPSRNLKRLLPELEHIRCQRAQILMDADSSLDNVFFPDSGVVSVVAVTIKYRYLPSAAFDQTGPFKLPGGIRDAWPLDTQHFGEQILSERERVTCRCGHASSAASALTAA